MAIVNKKIVVLRNCSLEANRDTKPLLGFSTDIEKQ